MRVERRKRSCPTSFAPSPQRPSPEQRGEHDSQEIRVCALVLSVLSFFLFIVAEILPTIQTPLVALGTLGFSWTGPLTMLAGTLRSKKFKLWQPFQGGMEFVWMQAFGWSLHSSVLAISFVVLANDRIEKWMEGQYLLLGITGFTAQLLLNLSIGCFNATQVDLPILSFPWNTKAVVSILLSASGAFLFLLFDLFGQSTVLVMVASITFVLSSMIIHVLYGCMDIPGYRIWQPFEGTRTFLLLQYLGWQFLAFALVGTMIIISSSTHSIIPRGARTAVGCMGLISQVLLLVSLQHFNKQDANLVDRTFAVIGIPEIIWRRRHGQPREVYVSALLCLGAIGLGTVSYIARHHDYRVYVATSTGFQMFMLHEKVLWAIGICALALATPIVNLGAVRAYRGYRWWQPFVGGTKFVFLQTLGWLWYADFLAASIIFALNNQDVGEKVAPVALLLGCASTSALTCSIYYFVPRDRTKSQPISTSVPVYSTYQSIMQKGEIAISFLLLSSCVICHACVDSYQETLHASVRVLLLVIGTLVFLLACIITHESGRRLYPGFYRLVQPFEGGHLFVLRQAIGWTLVAVQLLFDTLMTSLPSDSLPHGVATLVGLFSLIPHFILVSSIRCFKPLQKSILISSSPSSMSRYASHIPSRDWWHVFKRYDVRWRVWVNGTIAFGSMILFGLAEIFRPDLRFRHADQVLYAFGCLGASGSVLFTHCSLGPRIQPGYRLFQPFRGGLRFITFQWVAWTLVSVAWAVALTTFYYRTVFFEFQGIHLLTASLFGVAQVVIGYSIPVYQPLYVDGTSHTRIQMQCTQWAHDFFVGPLLGMTACVVFVLVDLAMLYYGPSLPVFPITMCAVLALFSAIPMTYKFVQSSIGVQAKIIGGSVVFLVLGSALWSFTILLGAVFCFRVWGMETQAQAITGMEQSPIHYMGTFTGGVGFTAQLVFIQASHGKMGPYSAKQSMYQAKIHLLSLAKWSYSMLALAVTLIYASLFPRHLPAYHVVGMALCFSILVIASACWIQRQIVLPPSRPQIIQTPQQTSHDWFIELETDCLIHLTMFLTITELVHVVSTCRSMYQVQTESFWQQQFIQRFRIMDKSKNVHIVPTNVTVISPFAMSWLYRLESMVLNTICRLEWPSFWSDETSIRYLEGYSTNQWKTMLISKEYDCWCEQCQLCGKFEILSHVSRQWERLQNCQRRVPSTWVHLCSCINPVTYSSRAAHRACLEGMSQSQAWDETSLCLQCHQRVNLQTTRYPLSLTELFQLTWNDFVTGREDFGDGFFTVVPMSVSSIILFVQSFHIGCFALYIWLALCISLCFIINVPRIQHCLDRIVDETGGDFIAYQRLFHFLALSSIAHVIWCLSTRFFILLDLLLYFNFISFTIVTIVLLLIYWQTNYHVATVDKALNGEASCVLCLLHLCAER